MLERIQNIIGQLEVDRKAALEANNFRAGKSLRDIQIRMARANLQGWFAQDAAIPVEASENKRNLSPEQLLGLESIGFTFVMNVRALSLDQLSEDPSMKHLFSYVTDIAELRNIVPVARQVAVNPDQPYVKGSENLGYDDQLEKRDEEVRKFRRVNLKRGTLEDIDFAPDRASVLSQLDFTYQAKFGQKLYPDYFVRSQDEYDHPRFGPLVTNVGRSDQARQLNVDRWDRQLHYPYLRLSLVATPAGIR